MSIKEELTGLIDVLKVAKKYQDSIEIDVVIDEFNKILDKENWISIEDRLPNAGDTVLAYVKHNYSDDGFRAYRVYEFDEYFLGMGNLCEVTHWQPLPEPPKEKTPESVGSTNESNQEI